MPKAIVGFDFGTHSTKIVYRLLEWPDLTRVKVLRIEDAGAAGAAAADGTSYPSFAVPSCACVVDGRIRLGSGALSTVLDGRPSLKVRLWDEECPWPLDGNPDNDQREQQRQQQRKLAIARYGDSRVLAVAYLAWAFRKVRKAILADVPDAELQIYMPAPIDHYGEGGPVKQTFFAVMTAAWWLAFDSATQGVELEDGAPFPPIEDAAQQALVDHERLVPAATERRWDVLPESLVPLVTLRHDPRFEEGYYLIVDCGGGSTEISMVLRYDQNDKVSCYEDFIYAGGSRSLQKAKQNGATSEQFVSLLRELSRYSRKVVAQAYMKVNNNPAAAGQFNKKIRILLLGGGMLDEDVEDMFYRDGRRGTKSPLMEYLRQQGKEEWTIHKKDLESIAKDLDVATGEARFLILARGLALGPAYLPDFVPPGDVLPLPRAPLIERRPHWEQ